jgi:hypothetical protein
MELVNDALGRMWRRVPPDLARASRSGAQSPGCSQAWTSSSQGWRHAGDSHSGLLAHVLVAKFMDRLPLYRQEAVFARAVHVIARSTLADWVVCRDLTPARGRS